MSPGRIWLWSLPPSNGQPTLRADCHLAVEGGGWAGSRRWQVCTWGSLPWRRHVQRGQRQGISRGAEGQVTVTARGQDQGGMKEIIRNAYNHLLQLLASNRVWGGGCSRLRGGSWLYFPLACICLVGFLISIVCFFLFLVMGNNYWLRVIPCEKSEKKNYNFFVDFWLKF